nr:protein NEDD1-like [Onthophagus taurus]
MLASCGKEVKIHEWPDGVLVGGVSSINGVTFKGLSWSHSGSNLLAVPSGHNPILLKECDNNDEANGDIFWADNLKGLNGGIESGIFPNTVENYLTIGLVTGQIIAYDIYDQCPVKNYVCLPEPVVLLDYTYDDTLLAAACRNGKIYFYDSNGIVNTCLSVPLSKSVSTMMFHPTSDSYLLAGSKEGILAGWDVNTAAIKFQCQNHERDVADVCMATEDLLISVSSDQRVLFYDLRSQTTVNTVNIGIDLTSVAYYAPNEDVLVGTSEGRILCFDKRQPSIIKHSFDSQKNSPVKHISFNTRKCVSEPKFSEPIYPENKIANQSLTSIFKFGDFINSDTFLSRKDDDLSAVESKLIPDINEPRSETMRIGEGSGAPFYQLIEENSLKALKQEIINTNKEIIKKFKDDISDEFFKIRMEVSREFCHLERMQNQKWREFHNKLSKLATHERKEHKTMSESQFSELTETFKFDGTKLDTLKENSIKKL